MEHKFGYIPVHSQFIETEEALNNIVGDYFNSINNIGGIRCNEEKAININPLAYLVVTGGTEQLLLNLIEKREPNKLCEPVILIAHPTHNSLPASLETLAKLQQDNISGQILYLNSPDDKIGLNKVTSLIKNVNVFEELKDTKIGLIGEPSDWLVASSPEPEAIKKTWGAEIIPIGMNEITESMENISEEIVATMLSSLTSEANKIIEPSNLEIQDNVKVYFALKSLIEKYGLSAITIRCFDLVLDKKTTGCFGLAQLNDEGYIAGCEGDLVSTIAMLWSFKLLNQIPWMANPVQLNEDENTLWLAHCTVPRSIVKTYDLRSHFESGLGVGIQGEFGKGPVTLLRLGGEKIENIWLAEGEIIQTGNSEHLCRTQIEIKLSNGHVSELLSSPLGNHIVLLNGSHSANLKEWWELMIAKK